MRVLAGSLRMTDDLSDGATNVECLRKMIWLPFYTAADFLLDILVHVQNEVKLDAEHNKKVTTGPTVIAKFRLSDIYVNVIISVFI